MLRQFTLEEVTSTVNGLSPNKAPGADRITNRVLKAGGECLALQIKHIVNACLALILFPNTWKTAWTAILKKPDKPN